MRDRTIRKMRKEMQRLPKCAKTRLRFLIRWSLFCTANTLSIRERRAIFERRRRRHRVGACWACAREAVLVRHHIIQIQNGGSNDNANLIRICDWCHAEIHPWLDMPVDHPVMRAIQELDGVSP